MPDTISLDHFTDAQTLFPLQLNKRWRVIDDPLQWILQYRRLDRVRSDGSEDPRGWVGRSFCRTRTTLIRCIRENCPEADSRAISLLEAILPQWHR